MSQTSQLVKKQVHLLAISYLVNRSLGLEWGRAEEMKERLKASWSNFGVRLVTEDLGQRVAEIDGVPSYCWHITHPAWRLMASIPRLFAERSSNLLSEDDIEELNAHGGVWEQLAC